MPDLGVAEDSFARGLDLALSLGGDGTMLRTVDLVAAEGVPVVGVNVGQLGYLTEVEPPGLRMALKRFLAGVVRGRGADDAASPSRPAGRSTTVSSPTAPSPGAAVATRTPTSR